jgi:hypothetical protein
MVRLLGLLVLLVGLSGCSGDPGGSAEPLAPVTPLAEPPGTSASAGLEEVSPGFDESPDGAAPPADDELDDAELVDVLRTRASVRASADHCGPDDVAVTLEGFDAAAGHRYSRIAVRNTGGEDCVVEGVPGIGVRGGWGSVFVPEVAATGTPPRRVLLAPGEVATSDLEWTGDLAGAESEPASLVVVQLASGQVPATTPARLATDAADAPPLDIGQFTTIQLSPFVAD